MGRITPLTIIFPFFVFENINTLWFWPPKIENSHLRNILARDALYLTPPPSKLISSLSVQLQIKYLNIQYWTLTHKFCKLKCAKNKGFAKFFTQVGLLFSLKTVKITKCQNQIRWNLFYTDNYCISSRFGSRNVFWFFQTKSKMHLLLISYGWIFAKTRGSINFTIALSLSGDVKHSFILYSCFEKYLVVLSESFTTVEFIFNKKADFLQIF